MKYSSKKLYITREQLRVWNCILNGNATHKRPIYFQKSIIGRNIENVNIAALESDAFLSHTYTKCHAVLGSVTTNRVLRVQSRVWSAPRHRNAHQTIATRLKFQVNSHLLRWWMCWWQIRYNSGDESDYWVSEVGGWANERPQR